MFLIVCPPLLARWLSVAATKNVISDLTGYTRALQTHADQSMVKDEPEAPCLFIPWTPPAKVSLSTEQLCSETLRCDGMPIKGTYAWSSIRVGGGVMLRRHPFADTPAQVAKAPLVLNVPYEAQEWRLAYRTQTPEADVPALGTLSRAWRLYEGGGHELATRRRPWSERVKAFLATKKGVKS